MVYLCNFTKGAVTKCKDLIPQIIIYCNFLTCTFLAEDQKIRQGLLCSSSSPWHLTFAFGQLGNHGTVTGLSLFYCKVN